ncbi:SNF2 family N-terminal domain-containing protein [Pyronema domesticum]|nr:SNF2 family N-terminal domain-containing protein [Pyronema domesticum]
MPEGSDMERRIDDHVDEPAKHFQQASAMPDKRDLNEFYYDSGSSLTTLVSTASEQTERPAKRLKRDSVDNSAPVASKEDAVVKRIQRHSDVGDTFADIRPIFPDADIENPSSTPTGAPAPVKPEQAVAANFEILPESHSAHESALPQEQPIAPPNQSINIPNAESNNLELVPTISTSNPAPKSPTKSPTEQLNSEDHIETFRQNAEITESKTSIALPVEATPSFKQPDAPAQDPTRAEPTPQRPTQEGRTPAGPIPARTMEAGRMQTGLTPAGPTTAGPIPAGPIPTGSTLARPAQEGPTTAGPTPVGLIPAKPSPATTKPSRPSQPIIDLTSDSDEDLVIVESKSAPARPRPLPPQFTPQQLQYQQLQSQLQANQQFQSSQRTNMPRGWICYGRLPGSINAHVMPVFHTTPATENAIIPRQFRIRRGTTNSMIIHSVDDRGVQFGNLGQETAKLLAYLLEISKAGLCSLDYWIYPFVTDGADRRGVGGIGPAGRKQYNTPTGPPGTQCSAKFEFFYNVYGSEDESIKIATLVSKTNTFFLQPHQSTYAREYKNAHEKIHGGPSALARPQTAGHSYITRTAEEMMNDFDTVFDKLDQADDLPEMIPAKDNIKTELLKHQKQGLYFLFTKEQERNYDEEAGEEGGKIKKMTLWRKKQGGGAHLSTRQSYYHIITGQEIKTHPPDVRGGILADMMGLGKTLQILCLITETKTEATAFGKTKPSKSKAAKAANDSTTEPTIHAKTTLLISPLSTISNWEDQIKTHVAPTSSLSYLVHHGSDRTKSPTVLAKQDLVITTYQILAIEFKKHFSEDNDYVSPLFTVGWFRVVLDEAHQIREQSTIQSKAAMSLTAQRRWAVTGTPVQNRLSDLASLIKFLRVKPFDETSTFTQWISAPLKNPSPTGDNSLSLRLLVDSITLRRQKDKISLPPKTDETIFLQFSPAEKEVYDATAKQSKIKVDMIVKSGSLRGRGYINMLQQITRLRLVSAHGRDLLADEDTADLVGLTKDDAIDVDSIDDTASNLTPRQAYSIFQMMRETDEDKCVVCNTKVVLRMPSEKREEEGASKSSTSTSASTRASTPAKGRKDGGGGRDKPRPKGHNPPCDPASSTCSSAASPEPAADPEEPPIAFLTPCAHLLCPGCVPTYLRYLGPTYLPTTRATCPLCGLYNLLTLFPLIPSLFLAHLSSPPSRHRPPYRGPSTKVRHLLHCLLADREANAEDPIKSVIFSTWTSHLDLIQHALSNASISFVRLDGSMSRPSRSRSLNLFSNDPSIEVILVSLQAGGVGLNLTAASRVYVMEPGWNPAAEQQAVERVHRIGQKREVKVVRWIMKGSFEDRILEVQKKKREMAEMVGGKRVRKGKEGREERLRRVVDMFR